MIKLQCQAFAYVLNATEGTNVEDARMLGKVSERVAVSGARQSTDV